MYPADGAVTPSWLTDTLRRAGTLPQGRVESADQRGNSAFNSATVHLTLTYSSDAPDNAPTHLLLKRSLPEAWAIEAGAREVAFYRLVAARPDSLPMIVRCYAAEIDDRTGHSVVLLDDLSATHRAAFERHQLLEAGQNVPTDAVITQVLDALAGFHAAWWEHPKLGQSGAGPGPGHRDRVAWDRYMERRAKAWSDLIAAEGEWFPDDLRRLYDHALARVPLLWQRILGPRLADHHAVTLTHGDAYFANFLSPRHPADDRTYIIDWQSPEMHVGASDLVTMICTFWTSEQRRAENREERMLRRYHAILIAHGVSNYPWEALRADYKLGLIEWLLQPVQDAADGASRDYWWPKMQCLAGAYRDHCAADLIDSLSPERLP